MNVVGTTIAGVEPSSPVAEYGCDVPIAIVEVVGLIVTDESDPGIGQVCRVELELRGAGAPVVKSDARLPLFAHPALMRNAAVVFVNVAVVP